MKKEYKTYEEVGKALGLSKITLGRYVAYMTKRWETQEEINCLTGYAAEWAERFQGNREYPCSDLDGRRVLKAIDGENPGSTKVIEIWDEDCGWKHYCDACGANLSSEAVKEVREHPPAVCSGCGVSLTVVERV